MIETTFARNQRIKTEYLADKKDEVELARVYGMTAKRIKQILQEQRVALRTRQQRVKESRPICQLHERIGRRLCDHRVEHEIDLEDAAHDLNITKMRLIKIEKGTYPLQVLDQQNVAGYLGLKVSVLLGEKDD